MPPYLLASEIVPPVILVIRRGITGMMMPNPMTSIRMVKNINQWLLSGFSYKESRENRSNYSDLKTALVETGGFEIVSIEAVSIGCVAFTLAPRTINQVVPVNTMIRNTNLKVFIFNLII